MTKPPPKTATKIQTLKKRAEFVRAAQGARHYGKALMVQHNPGYETRFGYTAASARVGNAIERNRAKRRLRAVVQKLRENFAAVGGHFVLVATKDTNAAEFDILLKDAEAALSRFSKKGAK